MRRYLLLPLCMAVFDAEEPLNTRDLQRAHSEFYSLTTFPTLKVKKATPSLAARSGDDVYRTPRSFSGPTGLSCAVL